MNRSAEHGMALVSVLGMLTLFMMLIGLIVAMSQTTRFTTATAVQLEESVYRNESAGNRALWLLMNDRTVYTDRSLSPDKEQLVQRERFRADGRIHIIEVDGIPVEVRITDMNRGLNLSGFNPGAAFNVWNAYFERRPEERRAFDIFKNRLMDYVDSDDLLRTDGMENADYEILRKQPLPRNAPLQYAEEILWVPGAKKFIHVNENGELPDLTPIAPRGLQFYAGRPNVFSATPQLIQRCCDFTDPELVLVTERLQKVRDGIFSITEAFYREPFLLERLKQRFSFGESSYYTFAIRIGKGTILPGRTLVVSIKLNQSLADREMQLMEWKCW